MFRIFINICAKVLQNIYTTEMLLPDRISRRGGLIHHTCKQTDYSVKPAPTSVVIDLPLFLDLWQENSSQETSVLTYDLQLTTSDLACKVR